MQFRAQKRKHHRRAMLDQAIQRREMHVPVKEELPLALGRAVRKEEVRQDGGQK